MIRMQLTNDEYLDHFDQNKIDHIKAQISNKNIQCQF